MHRATEITAPPASTDALIPELEKSDHLIGLSVHCGASIKPPGDVLMVHALNRDADRVMQLVDEAHVKGQISVTTHELTSIVDPEHERAVANDIDEALWESSKGERPDPHRRQVSPGVSRTIWLRDTSSAFRSSSWGSSQMALLRAL